jgi:hypothetical protein
MFSKWSFPSGFPNKTLHAPLLSPHVPHTPPIPFFVIWSPIEYPWEVSIIPDIFLSTQSSNILILYQIIKYKGLSFVQLLKILYIANFSLDREIVVVEVRLIHKIKTLYITLA